MLINVFNKAYGQSAYNIYYVPLPETEMHGTLNNFTTAINLPIGNELRTIVSIVVTEADAIIYYDHWEDGYETDIENPVQATTQIWGDNNPANGIPPGHAVDLLGANSIIALDNTVMLPRNPSQVRFDGRDKIAATKFLAVSRSGYALLPGPVLAGAVEALDVSSFGLLYELPVGENTPSSGIFEQVDLFVMASQDATLLQVDRDGNGTTDITITIGEGENYYLSGGLNSGATITSNKPIQTHIITGDLGGRYESRFYTLYAKNLWDNCYYNPVGTTISSDPVHIFLYNPNATAITIFHNSLGDNGSFSVPANGVYRFEMPANSGAHFYTLNEADIFFAIGVVDADTGNNDTHDWGFSLLPESYLTNSGVVGWGPGSGNLSGNGNPVWITASNPTIVYIDFDNDPTTGPFINSLGDRYDEVHSLSAFESIQIYDYNDNDQTGMHIYTIDGTRIALAWGQDPATSQPGNPFLDLGTTIPPTREIFFTKTANITNDLDGDGLLDPGDEVTYTLNISNLKLAGWEAVTLKDILPAGVTYINNSTQWNGISISDDAPTPFPLDDSGLFLGDLLSLSESVVSYKVITENAALFYTTITNSAELSCTSGETWTVQETLPVDQGNITNCTLEFTDNSGNPLAGFLENETICITLHDSDKNINSGMVEAIGIILFNINSLDRETITLTETGTSTGIFRGCVNNSTTGGQNINDGILNALTNDNLSISYTDPLYGDLCDDNAIITPHSYTKQLYLSTDGIGTPDQDLDRIDPVATNDVTTAVSDIQEFSSGNAIISLDAVSSDKDKDINNLNISHTTGNGNNRYMLVGVSLKKGGNNIVVNSVTYGGISLNAIGFKNSPAGDIRIELFELINPPNGIADVSVVLNQLTSGLVIGVATFEGVNQTTPTSAFITASGDIGNPSLSISSTANELIFDVLAHEGGFDINPGAGQTERYNLTRSGEITGGGSTEPGAASVTMNWSVEDNGKAWAMGAVSIKPTSVSSESQAIFSQTTSFCSDFIIPANTQISIITYVNVLTGTMPPTPDITAVLEYGTTDFATLTNASYNSGTGILSWNYVTESTTIIPAGEQVVLKISLNELGYAFQIEYDSNTKPSRIELPATTVISINDLTIYDAPFPGGNPSTGAFTNQEVCIRTTVSDPLRNRRYFKCRFGYN